VPRRGAGPETSSEYNGSAVPMSDLPLAGARVLVVDDHDDLRDIMGMIVRGAGAKVMVAASCGEAIAAMMSHRPGVVVTDLAMPGGTGAEVLSACREVLGPSVASILVTAFVGDESRALAADHGFDAYLEKPFSGDRLVETVVDALSRAGARSARQQSGVRLRPSSVPPRTVPKIG
jgi:CheY-like chemotaxis protein